MFACIAVALESPLDSLALILVFLIGLLIIIFEKKHVESIQELIISPARQFTYISLRVIKYSLVLGGTGVVMSILNGMSMVAAVYLDV